MTVIVCQCVQVSKMLISPELHPPLELKGLSHELKMQGYVL